jgi:hypothetical protein
MMSLISAIDRASKSASLSAITVTGLLGGHPAEGGLSHALAARITSVAARSLLPRAG